MGKFFKEKKIGLSFLILFFLLLVISLLSRNIFPQIYQLSIIFAVLIFQTGYSQITPDTLKTYKVFMSKSQSRK